MIDRGGPVLERFLHLLDIDSNRKEKPCATLFRGLSIDLIRFGGC